MSQGIQHLLDRLGVVRRACDLDLLLFLHRHPRILLPCEERLASFTGYDLDDVARSLETLIHAGLVERRRSRSRAACVYVLVRAGRSSEWLVSLLAIASMPGGRAEVLRALWPGCGPEETAPDAPPAHERAG